MEHLDDDAEFSVQWMARLKGSQCPKSWRNPPNRQSKEENEVLNISKPSIFTWFHGVPHFYPGFHVLRIDFQTLWEWPGNHCLERAAREDGHFCGGSLLASTVCWLFGTSNLPTEKLGGPGGSP